MGAGGQAQNSFRPGNNGEDSVFADLTVKGGGGGGNWCDRGCVLAQSNRPENSNGKTYNGWAGGSGGGSGSGLQTVSLGGASTPTAVSGTATFYGNSGGASIKGDNYTGAGGGGAGSVGVSGGQNILGNGGSGIQSSITGTIQWYAGGGGGSSGNSSSYFGIGGSSVGGRGSDANGDYAGNGLENTGSGGGGVQGITNKGTGAGGSGIVVVSYSIEG